MKLGGDETRLQALDGTFLKWRTEYDDESSRLAKQRREHGLKWSFRCLASDVVLRK